MKLRIIFLAISAFAIGRASADIIVIGFDEFPSGTVITNQYSTAATFSSSFGHDNYAIEFAGTVTHPNMLCTGSGAMTNCLEDTYIDFTVPLSGYGVSAILQNSESGNVAQVNLFENGIHTRTEFVTGLGHPGNRGVHFDNLNNLTRLEIVNIVAPTGWDNMILVQVPEPASVVWLSSLGFLALRRRRGK